MEKEISGFDIDAAKRILKLLKARTNDERRYRTMCKQLSCSSDQLYYDIFALERLIMYAEDNYYDLNR